MNLTWTKTAKQDISNIENYYIEAGVPKEIIYNVILDIYKTSKVVKEFPLVGTVVDEGEIRKFPVTKYIYVIVFRVEADTVKIIRVLDTRNQNKI